MKIWIVSILVVLGSLKTHAQQEYFLYLQTDNKQAFYVRLNNKIYSSTESGYLILSKLPDSTHQLSIGFPKNTFPEQIFSVPQNRKDAGYLLKNFGDNGWGLFNIQTLAIIMNSNIQQEKKSPDITGVKKNDAFTVLLSNAVNDTAILYNTVYKTKTAPAEPVVVNQEKKKLPADSLALTKVFIMPVKDTILAKTKPVLKNDSTAIADNQQKLKKDTASSIAKKQLPPDSSAVTFKYIKPVKDTILSAKKTVADDSSAIAVKKTPVITSDTNELYRINKKEPLPVDSSATAKKFLQPVKDTILSTASNNNVPKIDSTTITNTLPAVKKDTIALAEQKKELKNPEPIVHDNKSRADSGGAVKTSEPLFRPLKQPVTKAAEALTDTSYIAVFVDESKDKFDTIRISIPFNESSLARKTPVENPPPLKIIETTAVKPTTDSVPHYETVKKEEPKETKPLVKPEIKPESKVEVPPAKKDTVITTQKPVLLNSDCKADAWDSDIDKLRIKMMAVKTDEEKIMLAKKLFKEKCFSVKQVKALSELFTTDEAKYKWFDAVYPFTSDAANFGSLGELIKEEYYLNRFKAMLRN